MKSKYKQLKRMSISDEAFLKVLDEARNHREKVDDILVYAHGYPDKFTIRYTDDALIAPKNYLCCAGALPMEELVPGKNWYQILCVRNDAQLKKTANLSSPAASCRRVKKILHKYYTDEEIERIFGEHEDEESSIIHIPTKSEKGKILKFENCWYYDASGAYGSELAAMFPKCKDEFAYRHAHRHDNNDAFKNDNNFFVGCLTQNEKKREAIVAAGKEPRKIYPKTRHYIVNRITKRVTDLIHKCNPELIIYANTDGVVMQNPKNTIKSSEGMGGFKLEHAGTIYTYRGDNYVLIQMGEKLNMVECAKNMEGDMVGNLPLVLREKVDLREGRVVKFKKTLINGVYQYTDIKEIQL